MSALDTPSIQKRGEPLDGDSQAPKYGFAGNRCFTPEARFTGVMDFLTQVTIISGAVSGKHPSLAVTSAIISSPSHRLRRIRATRKQSSAPSTKMTWQPTAITTRTRLTTIRFRLIKVFCPRFACLYSRLEWAVHTQTHPGLPPHVAACSGACTWLHRICERHVRALD